MEESPLEITVQRLEHGISVKILATIPVDQFAFPVLVVVGVSESFMKNCFFFPVHNFMNLTSHNVWLRVSTLPVPWYFFVCVWQNKGPSDRLNPRAQTKVLLFLGGMKRCAVRKQFLFLSNPTFGTYRKKQNDDLILPLKQ